MIYFILIGYVLPMVVNGIYLYNDKDIKTIGDFVELFWMLITPFVNFVIMCIIPLVYIVSFLEKKLDIGTMWKNLMDKKELTAILQANLQG